MQGNLFQSEGHQRHKIGHSSISYVRSASILTKTSGFMDTYDYSLNPYSGCSFGCTYCYAAFFSRDKEKMDNWGYWVDVKENALSLLAKFRQKPLINKSIYLGSVTDPYQPIEREIGLTRSILEELLEFHDVRLVIQTRSQLVTRDIDLMSKFKVLQVNMTVTTDSEQIRKVFEPLCPGNGSRLAAIKEVQQAGVQACITMTPLLPVEDPEQFAKDLVATGVKRFIVQPFHADRGKFVAGTREKAKELLEKFKWDIGKYNSVVAVLKKYIPDIGIGKDGFAPI